MQLTKSCYHAVRGLLYLAGRQHPEEPVLLRDIAAAVNAPEAFLSKTFQTLRGAGIVRSHRGTARGYSLARDAGTISVYDAIIATQGVVSLHSAELLGVEVGSAFADVWRDLEEQVANRLRSATIKDLVSQPTGRKGHKAEVAGA